MIPSCRFPWNNHQSFHRWAAGTTTEQMEWTRNWSAAIPRSFCGCWNQAMGILHPQKHLAALSFDCSCSRTEGAAEDASMSECASKEGLEEELSPLPTHGRQPRRWLLLSTHARLRWIQVSRSECSLWCGEGDWLWDLRDSEWEEEGWESSRWWYECSEEWWPMAWLSDHDGTKRSDEHGSSECSLEQGSSEQSAAQSDSEQPPEWERTGHSETEGGTRCSKTWNSTRQLEMTGSSMWLSEQLVSRWSEGQYGSDWLHNESSAPGTGGTSRVVHSSPLNGAVQGSQLYPERSTNAGRLHS